MRHRLAAATVRVDNGAKGGESMDDLGWGFGGKLAGLFVAGAIILSILTVVFLHAIYAWGLFGTFLLLAVVALIAGWFVDRRNANRHESITS